ncbi:MAG: TetR/AcrR family transcriptional regulator [Lachnospiraceae bacterium]|nr:TetR/AcrR family transcriptional regulator [Lachnospiraceae bacterium]MDD3616400.1 TetR/AcrR family transcriptional regulator [Lachnospiraceae bacterium]
MGKLDLNKKEKKDALLKTAFDLFMSQGINKTSISDIVNRAGVAKGTFYLYFKDKYDIRNHLIAAQADKLLIQAIDALKETNITDFTDSIIFIVDYIIDCFDKDRTLLTFISKHLSWGIFKNVLTASNSSDDLHVYGLYQTVMMESGYEFRNPEIMIYMIMELVSGTSYSAILYEQPAPIAKIKPHIYETIRFIIQSHILSKHKDGITDICANDSHD